MAAALETMNGGHSYVGLEPEDAHEPHEQSSETDDSDDAWPEIEHMAGTGNTITKEAFATLIDQVGRMYAGWQTMQETALKNSIRIEKLEERMQAYESSAFRADSSSPPPPSEEARMPQLVESNDTLGSILADYVMEDSPTGIHKVFKISKRELAVKRFTELKSEAEAREAVQRWQRTRRFLKHYAAKGAGHAFSHLVTLLLGALIAYLLHRAGSF